MRTSFRPGALPPNRTVRFRPHPIHARPHPVRFLASSPMGERSLFTSESVAPGHPDKVADQVSDAVLDFLLARDPQARVACETFLPGNRVIIGGEITTKLPDVPYEEIVRGVIARIGYNRPELGFDAQNCQFQNELGHQSLDIARGVDAHQNRYHDLGAGDQGMMFGFACDETPERMPAAIFWAHRLIEGLVRAREEQILSWLRPDGKSQVTVEYLDGRVQRIHTVVLSAQHDDEIEDRIIRDGLMAEVIRQVLPPELLDDKTLFHINPTGRFVTGGPVGDSGLTGRKIIVDTYGGRGRHGGGAFSGKDPSKVDRSGAYAMRQVAKAIVDAGLAKTCEVQVAYAIGVPEPVSFAIEATGSPYPTSRLTAAVRAVFDLRPGQIIERLDLLKPRYLSTASLGHFGRPDFPWEKTEPEVEALRAFFSASGVEST